MAIQEDKTYVFITRRMQSNWLRGDKASVDASVNPIYTPYQGLLESEELRGSSTNDVLINYKGRWKQATRGEYGTNIYINDGFDGRLPRTSDSIGVIDVIAEKFRNELDLAGNNNPLYILQIAFGSMSTQIQTNGLDLNRDSREMSKYIEDEAVKLLTKIRKDGGDPYVIEFDCQGEGGDADRTLNRNKLLRYTSQRGFPNNPVILFPINWDTSSTLTNYNNWVHNNLNLFWCLGDKYQDVIDRCVSDDPTISPLDDDTFTKDGLHFKGTIQVLYGLMVMPRLIEVSSGFGEDLL